MHLSFFYLLLVSLFSVTLSCRNQVETSGESEDKALESQLSLESELRALEPGTCLVEFKENFRGFDDQSQSIGQVNSPICIESEVARLELRGRVDVDENKDPGKLAIALIVDSSGSLLSTDPNKLKDGAIIKFLENIGKAYRNSPGNLKITVFFSGDCNLSDYQKSFVGSSYTEYQAFLNSIKFPPTKFETNFLNVFQLAHEFLTSSLIDASFTKNVILFSDGMPWAKGNKERTLCPGVLTNLKDRVRQPGFKITGGLGQCAGIYGVSPDPSLCSEPAPRSGFGGFGNDPSRDPANVLLAIEHHIDFAERNFKGKGIDFYSVFLKTGKCWEYRNTSGQAKSIFSYMCDDLAYNDFLTRLSGDDSKVFRIGEATKLDGAFSALYSNLFKQMELSGITAASRSSQSVGVVCNQIGTSVECPLGDKPFSPSFSAGEGGAFNFHIPVGIYAGNDVINLNASFRNDQRRATYKIPLHYSDSSCAGSPTVFTYIENGYENEVAQREYPRVRVSCKSRKFLGCVTETGTTVADGAVMGTKTCINTPRCGENQTLIQRCERGKPVPDYLSCPADSKTVEQCKPVVCDPTETVPLAGKEGHRYRTRGKGSTDLERCMNAVSFECRGDSWVQVQTQDSECQGGCASNQFITHVGKSGDTRQVESFSQSESASCLAFKSRSTFECRAGTWTLISGAQPKFFECRQPRSGCNNFDVCGGSIFSTSGNIENRPGDPKSKLKRSTAVGVRFD